MTDFRQLVAAVDDGGELLRVARAVDAEYELGALLQQAEARRKAILFESVKGSEFPVVGGLLTSSSRFALALNKSNPARFSRADHVQLVAEAIRSPLPIARTDAAACKHTVLKGSGIDCTRLPVPTFFEGDSGPFMTAAIGISRNPDNGVINAGFYRILLLGRDRIVINVSAGSGLKRFFDHDSEQGTTSQIALVIGAEPALLMAAAAKVPADVSELGVAGALQGAPLDTVTAECSDLPVPASAEFVIEVAVDHSESVDNRMGEYGDLYGSQAAPVGKVQAITHKQNPLFHTVMAGAGKEHNTLGQIILYPIEPDLAKQLAESYPDVNAVRVICDPPSISSRSEIHVRVSSGRAIDAAQLIEHIFSLTCGGYPLARVVRKIVLVDVDIDIDSRREVGWAVAARATQLDDYLKFEQEMDTGMMVRLGIDARAHPGSGTERLVIPGAGDIHLDDYL
jgi:2,5-furandicarboxylate decarboxylase 1